MRESVDINVLSNIGYERAAATTAARTCRFDARVKTVQDFLLRTIVIIFI